jgi:hypothetical protein
MNDLNPIVQATAQGTFNEVINSLQFVITSLEHIRSSAGEDEDEQKMLTAAEVAGLCLHLQSIKLATESGFAQCSAQKLHGGKG